MHASKMNIDVYELVNTKISICVIWGSAMGILGSVLTGNRREYKDFIEIS